MSALPPPIEAFPLVSAWIRFCGDGTVAVFSGRVDFGQGIATALTQIVADELGVPMAAIRLTQGHTGRVPVEGPTVGSLSVSIGGQSLRLAAAAARAVMLDHAAGLLQAIPAALTVQGGAILKDGVETGLSYASLAGAVDLAVPVAGRGAPVAAAARAISGTPAPRVDLAARMGAGHLLHDMVLPDMLHARVLFPPSPEAGLGDTGGLVPGPGAALMREGRFLAVVAADEYRAVTEAARLAPMVPWAAVPPAMHPLDGLDGTDGPAETLLGAAPDMPRGTEISVTLTKPVLSHGSIGPSCAVALWTDGHLKVWAHSQNVFALKDALATMLGIASDRVEVIFAPGAGCYGHNSSDDVAGEAALIAHAHEGSPVRVLSSRAQEFQASPLSPAMCTTATARLDADGALASVHVHVVSPPHSTRPGRSGAPNLRAAALLPDPIDVAPGVDMPLPQGGAERNAVPPYRTPALHITRARPAAVPYRASAMRGLGAFANIIAIEALMDDCADAAGQDPIAYRLAHLDDPRARAVIEAARDMAGARQGGEGVGYGTGYSRYKNSAGYLACIARVVVDEEVRVTDVWTAFDVGEVINPSGAVDQVEGGIVQGISWTLKEEMGFAQGRNITESWDDYPILRFSEVPRLVTRLLPHPDAPPLGAGEISVGPAGAAVVCAVRAALGVTPDRLPLTRAALVTLLAG